MSGPTATLNDGRVMPLLGYGTWQVPDEDAPGLVREAIEAGYALIDTAKIYENESGVGEAVRAAPGPVWLTTKLWNSDQGYDKALRAADASLARLGMDAVDLYLMHWPVPNQDLYVESWQAMIALRAAGKALSIGVSNFNPDHLDRLEPETGVIPTVNQIELHPRFQQRELREYHHRKGIVTQSWSPLGQGQLLQDPDIGRIAAKHGCTPAQAIIAWHLALGLSVIPKSANPERLRANLRAVEVRLDEDDLASIEGMDDPNGRVGPDPLRF